MLKESLKGTLNPETLNPLEALKESLKGTLNPKPLNPKLLNP